MFRTIGAGIGGAAVGLGAAIFGELDPIVFGTAGAATALALPFAPRSAALFAAGAVSYGLFQLTEVWSAAALLFVGLVVIGELTRTSDRPESSGVEPWSPAIFWCAATALFFIGVWGVSVQAVLPTGAVLVFAVGPAIVASRVNAVAPVLAAVVVNAAAILVSSSDAITIGHAVGATLPLLTWSLRPMLRIRRQRLQEVGHAGSFWGVLASDLATCGAAGYTPRGSGTVGAVTALPLAWWLSTTAMPVRVIVIVVLTVLSIVVAYRYCAGSDEHLDPSEVVLDEYIGVLFPLVVVPWEWPWVVAAFVAFRFFDIAKPGPVGYIDRNVQNPSGIMLDDVVAGIFAAVLLFGIQRIPF